MFYQRQVSFKSNGPKCLPKNPTDRLILFEFFDNFILDMEPIWKALLKIEICVLVNNDLCGKL